MKFQFEVYCERHKTVEIEADNEDQAWEKLDEQLYDVDMDDAFECGERRTYLVKEDDFG